MKGIVTVLGKDQVGIIAAVCTRLSESGVNILDVSQTITGGYFNMMMVVDLSKARAFDDIAASLDLIGKKFAVSIRLQREDIFEAMHRV